jgi:hypothetical protein
LSAHQTFLLKNVSILRQAIDLRQTLDVILAAPFFKLSNQVFVNQLLDGFTFLRAHHVYVVNQMFKPSAGGHILSATEMRRLIKQLLDA